MISSYSIVWLCLLITLHSCCLSSATPVGVIGVNQNETAMELIGQVGQKRFYQSTVEVDGLEAKLICTAHGLQPGQLDFWEEFDWLAIQLPDTQIWTGGALFGQENNVGSKGAFAWADGTTIFNGNFMHLSNRWLCLYFHRHVLYPDLCISAPGTNRTVLCQNRLI